MVQCTAEFRAKYGDNLEPYRVVIKELRTKLKNTQDYYEDLLADRLPKYAEDEIIIHNKQLWEPLYDCYQSLIASF